MSCYLLSRYLVVVGWRSQAKVTWWPLRRIIIMFLFSTPCTYRSQTTLYSVLIPYSSCTQVSRDIYINFSGCNVRIFNFIYKEACVRTQDCTVNSFWIFKYFTSPALIQYSLSLYSMLTHAGKSHVTLFAKVRFCTLFCTYFAWDLYYSMHSCFYISEFLCYYFAFSIYINR